jgi:hypothetical protein
MTITWKNRTPHLAPHGLQVDPATVSRPIPPTLSAGRDTISKWGPDASRPLRAVRLSGGPRLFLRAHHGVRVAGRSLQTAVSWNTHRLNRRGGDSSDVARVSGCIPIDRSVLGLRRISQISPCSPGGVAARRAGAVPSCGAGYSHLRWAPRQDRMGSLESGMARGLPVIHAACGRSAGEALDLVARRSIGSLHSHRRSR